MSQLPNSFPFPPPPSLYCPQQWLPTTCSASTLPPLHPIPTNPQMSWSIFFYLISLTSPLLFPLPCNVFSRVFFWCSLLKASTLTESSLTLIRTYARQGRWQVTGNRWQVAVFAIQFAWYWCYFLHTSRDSKFFVCGICPQNIIWFFKNMHVSSSILALP